MKFRTLFLSFNIVFFALFLTVFFLPFSAFGMGALGSFWFRQWGLGALFVVVVCGVNVVFFMYWRLLAFLESQDWAGLAHYLEKKVYSRRMVTASSIRLLLESLFLLGDFDGVVRLSDRLAETNRARRARFAHRICAVLIVGKRYAEAGELCRDAAGSSACDSEWIDFFSLFLEPLLGNAFPESGFARLSDTARDPVVVALAGYLNAKPGRDAAAAERARMRVAGKYSRKKWDTLVREARTGIHVIVLSSLLGEVTDWLCLNGEAI